MGKNIPKIVCIVGRTCSGKDSITKQAVKIVNQKDDKKFDYHLVVSYTTRPKRDSETEGVEHKFITYDEFVQKYANSDGLLAHTVIDKNHYFVTVEYILELMRVGFVPVYIIDPDGLDSLFKAIDDGKLKEFNVTPNDVYILYYEAYDDLRKTRYLKRKGTDENDKEALLEFYKRSYEESKQFSVYEHFLFKGDKDHHPADKVISNMFENLDNTAKGVAEILYEIQFNDEEWSAKLDKCFPEIES